MAESKQTGRITHFMDNGLVQASPAAAVAFEQSSARIAEIKSNLEDETETVEQAALNEELIAQNARMKIAAQLSGGEDNADPAALDTLNLKRPEERKWYERIGAPLTILVISTLGDIGTTRGRDMLIKKITNGKHVGELSEALVKFNDKLEAQRLLTLMEEDEKTRQGIIEAVVAQSASDATYEQISATLKAIEQGETLDESQKAILKATRSVLTAPRVIPKEKRQFFEDTTKWRSVLQKTDPAMVQQAFRFFAERFEDELLSEVSGFLIRRSSNIDPNTPFVTPVAKMLQSLLKVNARLDEYTNPINVEAGLRILAASSGRFDRAYLNLNAKMAALDARTSNPQTAKLLMERILLNEGPQVLAFLIRVFGPTLAKQIQETDQFATVQAKARKRVDSLRQKMNSYAPNFGKN